jgi:tetratricopeptide (TPR) repeat protein
MSRGPGGGRMTSPLRDTDAADRAHLVKIAVWFGPAALIMLSGLWLFLADKGRISGWVCAVMLALDVPLVVLGVFAIDRVTTQASTSLVRTLYAAGDIAPPRTYPRQELLIVRGQYREAADYFRDHLTIAPDDHEARLRLAELLEKHLGDSAGAERLYLDVRRGNPDRGHEMRASNGLIDLYRAMGRRDRLLVELARFADRYRGTPGAAAAARLLTELKAEGIPAES